jgi:hypothetical protein
VRAETPSRALMGARSSVRHGAMVVRAQKQAVVVQHHVAVSGRGNDGLADRFACSLVAIRAASQIETCAATATATPNGGCVLAHRDGST